MAKLADALDLGSSAARHVGSTPIIRTKKVEHPPKPGRMFNICTFINTSKRIMANVVRENVSNLVDQLTVTVDTSDYLPKFEKKLKEYGKTANIPGFRKGFVPAGMIKKMYGAGIFQEEVLRAVEVELYRYLGEEKPKAFGQPMPLTNDIQLDMNKPAPFEFKFEMGLHPEINIPALADASFTKTEVEITDEEVAEELDRIQMKAGNMIDIESAELPEDLLTVVFAEVNESGELVEDGIKKENSVMLKFFSEALQKELKGKQAGDTVDFQLKESFAADQLELILRDLELDAKDPTSAEKRFKMTIAKTGRIEKRELNEAFFTEVFPGKGVTNEDEAKVFLKADLAVHWNGQAKNQLHDQIYQHLTTNTKFDLPETFLKRWLKEGGEKVKTDAEIDKEFPTFISQLSWTLISEKLMAEKKIDVSDEEIKESMKAEIMQYFGQMGMGNDMDWMDSYIDRMMKDEKHVDKTYRTLVTSKLFEALEADAKPLVVKSGTKEFIEEVRKSEV